MKRHLIEIGGEYAVDFVLRASNWVHYSPRVVVRRRCTIVDKRSNGRIVVQYRDKLCTNASEFVGSFAGAMINGKLRYTDGWRLAEVRDSAIVARWGEQKPVQVYDGRPKDESATEVLLSGVA